MRHHDWRERTTENALHEVWIGDVRADNELTVFPRFQRQRCVSHSSIRQVGVTEVGHRSEDGIWDICDDYILNLLQQVAALRLRQKILLRQNQLQINARRQGRFLEK